MYAQCHEFSAHDILFLDPLACGEMLSIPEMEWFQAEMFLSMDDLLVSAGFHPTQIFFFGYYFLFWLLLSIRLATLNSQPFTKRK